MACFPSVGGDSGAGKAEEGARVLKAEPGLLWPFIRGEKIVTS